jgi:CRP/FNR family nitrogen fixation transcriptional regulator
MKGEIRPGHAPGMHYLRQRQPNCVEDLAIPVYRDRGEEIHGSDCSDDYWYRLEAGAARCYIVLPGGRRQILDLLLPGDFFGFTEGEGHFYGVDAVVDDTKVACYPRKALQALADSDPAIAHEVSEMVLKAMARLQQLILILGRTTAREKVGAFLLRIMQRLASDDPDRLVLPTSRYDIAEYLGLSVETVSRALTDLKDRGLISLAGPRRVRIVDRQGLDGGMPPMMPDGRTDALPCGHSDNGGQRHPTSQDLHFKSPRLASRLENQSHSR